ncbi:MAG: class I SAM-dependent methyltransferase [Polyangiaceae bacterium]
MSRENNMWNERYAEPGFAYGTSPNDFLVEQVKWLPAGGDVLSLAEGEGRNAVWLAELGFRVTCVDISSVGLEKAIALANEHGVSLSTIIADLADFDLGSSRWDAVISVWAHVPSSVRVPLHQRVSRALKPGGVVILEAYTPAQIALGSGGPKYPEMCMTLDGLRSELHGLDFLVSQEIEREVHEGQYHNGHSAVVQVVAKRPLR